MKTHLILCAIALIVVGLAALVWGVWTWVAVASVVAGGLAGWAAASAPGHRLSARAWTASFVSAALLLALAFEPAQYLLFRAMYGAVFPFAGGWEANGAIALIDVPLALTIMVAGADRAFGRGRRGPQN